eukprot:NODE_22811_length_693_cov_4.104240.p4 GENE.NODE_22811_length_693_cov_4.104240~~NODE_22811_length_693_cov_4.104240.p4  ORF type:complete len:59 (-),score=4.89 NODE_22811_length_693_cov_4.104240:224-400(-)
MRRRPVVHAGLRHFCALGELATHTSVMDDVSRSTACATLQRAKQTTFAEPSTLLSWPR